MKIYTMKIYSPAGSLLRYYTNSGDSSRGFEFSSFSIRAERYPSPITYSLPLTYDEVVNSDIADIGNIVKLTVNDRDTTTTEKILHVGMIESVQNNRQNKAEDYADFSVVHIGSRLAQTPFMPGAKINPSEATANPKVIAQAIITNAILYDPEFNYVDNVTMTNASTATGQTIYFNGMSHMQAIDKIRDYYEAGFYFLVAGDATVYLRKYSESTVHTLVYGKNCDSLTYNKSAENITNSFIIFNGLPAGGGGIVRRYYNASSISSYRERFEYVVDDNITSTGLADIFGGQKINEKKEVRTQLTVRVFDNNYTQEGLGYDIESILPGDTLNLRNVSGQVTLTGLKITNVSYNKSGMFATITCDNDFESVADKILENSKDIEKEQAGDAGAQTYTNIAT